MVENLPARRDRRVWREAQALVAAGWVVSVLSPRGGDDPPYAHVEGVDVYTYRPPPTGGGPASFVVEYAYAFVLTALVSLRVWWRQGFAVLQVCNPPDIFFPLGVFYRLAGVKFVFDHHDLSPELYTTRYGRRAGPLLWALRALEQATFSSADHVISTNESYRQVALGRGRRRPDQVTVVRNGPDLENMQPVPAQPALKAGKDHLCCWFGNMGPQDGVDLALEAAFAIVHVLGRRDCHFAFVGKGECLEEMKERAARLQLDQWVTFTGWVTDAVAFAYLSTADIGLSPDPAGPLNDVSTMNKTMEYMAFGMPVVAFDLLETRVSAGEAALYAPGGDVQGFARSIAELLDDPEQRARRGGFGRQRVETALAWSLQRDRYVQTFESLVGHPQVVPNQVPVE